MGIRKKARLNPVGLSLPCPNSLVFVVFGDELRENNFMGLVTKHLAEQLALLTATRVFVGHFRVQVTHRVEFVVLVALDFRNANRVFEFDNHVSPALGVSYLVLYSGEV